LRIIALFCFATLACAASRASAQPVDPATRASARQLAEDAAEDYAKGDYTAAFERYTRADKLVPLPTLSVRIARCLDKLGRLVEAAERYLEATRMPLGDDARGLQAEAQKQAEAERTALLARVPSIVVEVAGALGATVTIDGAALPEALLGAKRMVDPGKHRVVVARGAARVEREIVVREGETRTVALDLAVEPVAPAPAAGPLPPGAPAVAPPTPPQVAARDGAGQRVAGLAIGGVGAAGLVVGGITGGLALAKRGAIGAGCVDTGPKTAVCTPTGKQAADGAKALALASTIGFAAGGGLLAVGVVVAAAAPRAKADGTGRWVGVEVAFAGPGANFAARGSF
jgi:hypothetical protein